jgi:tRNA A-37 threonylcarbamoyl transferase component Bud32
MIRRLGEYELLEEIGRGGMGCVYRARHAGLGRVVALKVLRAGQLASAAEVARFRAEARTAAALEHPHLVPVYEVGEVAGEHYFAMPLVEGESLGSCLSRLRTNLPVAARLLALVARAVAHAHERGIIHRDLKPGNILLDGEGQPHVCDFGLARRLDQECAATTTGVILGTADYLAPEQAAAGRGLTPAADVYSLGAILYEILTGRPPFRGEAPLEALRRARAEEPVPPRALNPAVPRALEAVCLKCLEKDPRRRYHSAAALAEDLDRWLSGKRVTARRYAALRRPLRRCLVGCAVLVVVALAAAVGVAAWEAAQRDVTYDADMGQAHTALNEGNYGAIPALLARHAGRLDHRGDEWRALTQAFQKIERYHLLFTLREPSDQAAFDNYVRLRGKEPPQVGADGAIGWQIKWAFSPDGRRLVACHTRVPIVIDAESGDEVSDPTEEALVEKWREEIARAFSAHRRPDMDCCAEQVDLTRAGQSLPPPYKRLSDEQYETLFNFGKSTLNKYGNGYSNWYIFWSADGKKALSWQEASVYWNVWDARDWQEAKE